MPTLSCPEAPPCTLVLLTVCRRKSLLLLLPPSRSRSLLPQSASTPSGSEDPFLLPSPPSNRCGSPSRSTTKLAHPSSTESASKPNTTSHQIPPQQQQEQRQCYQHRRQLAVQNNANYKTLFFSVCHFRSFAFWLVMYSLNYVV